MTIKIAIVGATGAVGRQMLCELEQLAVSLGRKIELGLYASARSVGQSFCFQEKSLLVRDLQNADQDAPWDYVLMSAGSEVAMKTASLFCDKGAIVIDNSRAFRDTEKLIVPEVNAQNLANVEPGDIIANPNCSTIQLVVCLAPLQRLFGIKSVKVATYQAVSGAGEKGQKALKQELAGGDLNSCFPDRIAGNLIPFIGGIDDEGHCEEEIKMVQETRKILDVEHLDVEVMTVRVPVENSHSEAVFIELEKEVTQSEVLAAFQAQAGLRVCEEMMPAPLNVSGRADVSIARVRLPYHQVRSRSVQFWNVADNLRKGAATNAVQILNELLQYRK
ncbi:MAG: aspartate-semialdehyde dehydrogenase [Oligoflexales bacterium]